jgi:hypothetical protein
MDEIEKSGVRLAHWIDHNVEHLKGYGEVATTLEKQGLNVVAEKIREGIHLIEAGNKRFQEALGELSTLTGQTVPPEALHHTHSHSHEEGHEHSHEHSHDHGHSHHHED